MPKHVEIRTVIDAAPDPSGDIVVLKAEAIVETGQITELEIAITTELAPSVAIALLATIAKARAERDGLEPALEVLAAAVVASGNAEKVRLQMLFDKGAVLPIEMPGAAAIVLKDDLVRAAKDLS